MHRPRPSVVHQFALEPLGQDAWRLSDGAVAKSDAGNLVAYVERLSSGGYESIWVRGSRGVTRHASIDEILLVAVERLHVPVITAGHKPDPIPHVPPLSAA